VQNEREMRLVCVARGLLLTLVRLVGLTSWNGTTSLAYTSISGDNWRLPANAQEWDVSSQHSSHCSWSGVDCCSNSTGTPGSAAFWAGNQVHQTVLRALLVLCRRHCSVYPIARICGLVGATPVDLVYLPEEQVDFSDNPGTPDPLYQ
jgi:hypothetical protein